MKHLRILAMCSIPIMSLAIVVAGCNETVSDIPASADNPYSFSDAVAAIQNAPNLMVSLCDSSTINLSASDQSMQKAQRYLEDSVLKSITRKKQAVVENGVTTTVKVTIPYAYGYFLTFELEDGTKLWFNCAGEEIWYETDDAIYQASCSADFGAFLDGLILETADQALIVTISATPLSAL